MAAVTVTVKSEGRERTYCSLTFDEMLKMISNWSPSTGVLAISF
jgi:hypothetical protein